MRRLNVQIQPTRAGNRSVEELTAYVRGAADGLALEFQGEDHGNDEGPYINLCFAAADQATGWSRLRQLFDNSEIGRAISGSTIVTCEGERGWDDYVLLHHFDPAVELDDVGWIRGHAEIDRPLPTHEWDAMTIEIGHGDLLSAESPPTASPYLLKSHV